MPINDRITLLSFVLSDVLTVAKTSSESLVADVTPLAVVSVLLVPETALIGRNPMPFVIDLG